MVFWWDGRIQQTVNALVIFKIFSRSNIKNMKTFILLPIVFCLFFNQKKDPSVSNDLNVFYSPMIDSQQVVDCQKSIQFDLTSVTTVRKNPKPLWQQRQEGQLEMPNVPVENVDEYTEKSVLDICIHSTGDCKWKVVNKEGKSPVYSPLSIYVVSCLRQMSGASNDRLGESARYSTGLRECRVRHG